jgi:hypothetical protein
MILAHAEREWLFLASIDGVIKSVAYQYRGQDSEVAQ